jgi:hypothetical protein
MLENTQAIAAWERTLDQLEVDLYNSLPLDIWQPPTDLPPMPPEVVDRVRRLLDQQGELLLQLESSRRKVRRHLQYLDANAAKGMPAGPLFIDAQS